MRDQLGARSIGTYGWQDSVVHRLYWGLGSTELLKEWLESSVERGIPFLQFPDQTRGRYSESPTQFRLIERADKRTGERVGHGGGEAIDAAPVDGVLSQTEAGEGKGVITDPTDPVFGLPWLVAFDARASVEDVVPAQSDEGGGAGLRCGLKLPGGAEESAEVRAARAEFLCGCHRHVDLQTTGQKEHAVDTGAEAQVEMVEHAEFPIEHLRPVIKDRLRRDA
ncbi:MAG TPA: hypothetical protein VF026_02960 [Ktedonobacteraceae bacterium]